MVRRLGLFASVGGALLVALVGFRQCAPGGWFAGTELAHLAAPYNFNRFQVKTDGRIQLSDLQVSVGLDGEPDLIVFGPHAAPFPQAYGVHRFTVRYEGRLVAEFVQTKTGWWHAHCYELTVSGAGEDVEARMSAVGLDSGIARTEFR